MLQVHRFLPLAFAVATLLSLAGPPAAAAAINGPTMVVTLRAFPGGTEIPDQIAGTFSLAPGAPVSIQAPQTAYGPGPGQSYGFIFWNITTDIRTTTSLSFNAPTDTSTIHVTAWYLASGIPCTGVCPPTTPSVVTYAFSLNSDQVIADTPIASVTPSSAWSGAPSTSVSTTSAAGPVAVTARHLIGGSGLFHNWLQFGSGTISNAVLTVPNRGSSLAIAFFGVPVPDPCQDIRNELEFLSPGDFLNLQAYQRARAQLAQQLMACERQYGEL